MIIEKEEKFNDFYMKIAIETSKLSYAVRRKVGSIIVNNDNIISFGYNGTPKNFSNECEVNNITKPEVIHSELNAIIKAAKSGAKLENAILYVTLSPCVNCSLLIIQSGIKKVFYLENYRDLAGLDILRNAGIEVVQKNI